MNLFSKIKSSFLWNTGSKKSLIWLSGLVLISPLISPLIKPKTHKNQSTAIIMEISLAGSPKAVRTISIVTSPADGIEAAPMDARVAVMDTVTIWPIDRFNPFIWAMKIEAVASYRAVPSWNLKVDGLNEPEKPEKPRNRPGKPDIQPDRPGGLMRALKSLTLGLSGLSSLKSLFFSLTGLKSQSFRQLKPQSRPVESKVRLIGPEFWPYKPKVWKSRIKAYFRPK